MGTNGFSLSNIHTYLQRLLFEDHLSQNLVVAPRQFHRPDFSSAKGNENAHFIEIPRKRSTVLPIRSFFSPRATGPKRFPMAVFTGIKDLASSFRVIPRSWKSWLGENTPVIANGILKLSKATGGVVEEIKQSPGSQRKPEEADGFEHPSACILKKSICADRPG